LATRRHFVKLKVFVVTLAAASLCVSVAVAAPPPGKGKPETAGKPATAGKPETTGSTCKPKVTVVLKGTLTGMTTLALTVDVTSGNRWGRAYDEASHSIMVNEDTKVRGEGKKELDDLVLGDRVLVQARACKAELLAPGDPPVLTAVRVVAHSAAA
jgi:hypothetical protein